MKKSDVLRETIVVFSRFRGMLFHVEHILYFIFLYPRHLLDLIVSRGTIVQLLGVLNRWYFAEFEKQIQNYNFSRFGIGRLIQRKNVSRI
jgi:hypothetical protein